MMPMIVGCSEGVPGEMQSFHQQGVPTVRNLLLVFNAHPDRLITATENMQHMAATETHCW